MRVITGKAKGHRLKAPKRAATRPATDLVRGAIFSILETTNVDWTRVLDLFAGSGALGIEALSRGADWVDFVEHEPRCCAIIKQNLEKTKLEAQAHIYCCSVAKAISFPASIAAAVGISPAPPTIAETTRFTLSEVATFIKP